jgi:signal transduction histidine kinase
MEILRTASARLSGNASRITHNEKLVALGKFSAGLAHELNNPASAARRAAQTFQEMMSDLLARSVKLCALDLDTPQLDRLLSIEHSLYDSIEAASSLSPLDQSDREEELITWMDELAVEDAYAIAPVFASSGLQQNQLQDLLAEFPAAAAAGILEWLSAALNARSLLNEINDSTTRISDLVRAVKEYTYMDQDDVQEVDVHKSLDTTLKVLAHKVGAIQIVREYDPTLPKITANGSELNQVWTNLIDNAIDAVKDKPDGRIQLSTRCESDFVMVAVSDNGAGIPKNVLPRIFEPFYTTKGVGEGTGLGLDIVFRIVTQHEGTIEAESTPGDTRFTVRLPVEPKLRGKS